MLHASQVCVPMADGRRIAVQSPLPRTYESLLTRAKDGTLDDLLAAEPEGDSRDTAQPADEKHDD
jgi:hypothetical protein